MNLTPEQRELGKRNFERVLGVTRRDFLKTATAGLPAGAFYFGYKQVTGNPVRAGIIGTGDEGGVLITEHNPQYLQFVAYCDIRPSNQKRAMEGDPNSTVRIGFKRKYGVAEAEKIKLYVDYKDLLADPNVEMIVIALPLHLHAPVAIEAMKAGKHVLTEKLMAHSVSDCKEMIRVSRDTRKLLAVGHQRHYSVLYDNAVAVIHSGVLGDIRHVRALWHRNNTWPQDPEKPDGPLRDSWKPKIPAEDESVPADKYGYKSVEELVRWRLFDRTGGGLMAELGSHQLDACSIFLGKKHPLAVQGVGVKSFYKDERDADDHVFCTFEFPGANYDPAKNPDDVVVVTYSSINTNSLDPYGETVYGSRGTMMVEREQDVLLFKERNPNVRTEKAPASTQVGAHTAEAGKPVLDTSTSPGDPAAAMAVATGQISRGYREELEHFAYTVSNFKEADYEPLQTQLRCRGEVALADAVVALVSNTAMQERRRIEYKPEWFDASKPDVPEPGSKVAKS